MKRSLFLSMLLLAALPIGPLAPEIYLYYHFLPGLWRNNYKWK